MLLVEADTVEEAFDLVEVRLADGQPSWSDWHEASDASSLNFAGRWTGVVFADTPEVEDTSIYPNYLQYSSDPDLAEQAITIALEHRMTDIRAYRQRIRTSGIDLPEYPYNPNETTFDTEVWYVEKLTQLLMDKWTPDSGIYDLDAWTGSLKYFIERVKANPEKQWLIPVDFHH